MDRLFNATVGILLIASFSIAAVTISPQRNSRTFRNDTNSPIIDYLASSGYNYADDAEFDGHGFMYPYEAETGANGKTYHYIFGATTSGGLIYTFPIDARDYKNISFQILESNAGNVAGHVPYATVSGNATARFAIRGEMYPQHFITSGYSGYTYLPADVINSTTYAEDLTGGGAAKAIPTLNQYGIYRFELGGAISRIIFSCSATDVTGGIKSSTQHLIIRLNN